MDSSGKSGTARIARKKSQAANKNEKLGIMMKAHKIFVLHKTVMKNDPKCLEVFEKNCIVIPVAELQEVANCARGKEIDFGAWKFIQNLSTYKKNKEAGGAFKTKSGATVILDSNGNNFEDLSPGLKKNKENRIFLIAWNIINELCEHKEKQKGSVLTEEEMEEIIAKVIIVSSETETIIIGQQEGLETQEYKSGNFISNINDLYTGMAELSIKASSENMIEIIAEDEKSSNKSKVIKGAKLSRYTKLSSLYPNQCCILKFNDDIRYAIYKKSKNIFRVIDQRPEEKGEKISPRNMEQVFFEALVRDKSIAVITVTGGAGTGKSIMVAKAAMEMLERKKDMGAIIYRPIVDNGEKLGYLPGEYEDKIERYIQPMVDAFYFVSDNGKPGDFTMPPKNTPEYQMYLKNGNESKIEAYFRCGRMRRESINFIQGKTNHNFWMIIDESQDFKQPETENLITRIGNRGKILMTGDLYQIHRQSLQPTASGLAWVVESFKNSEMTAQINFTKVYRHPFVEEVAAVSRL